MRMFFRSPALVGTFFGGGGGSWWAGAWTEARGCALGGLDQSRMTPFLGARFQVRKHEAKGNANGL